MQCTQKKVTPTVGHVKPQTTPFAPHGEEVEDLAVDDAVHDVGTHHQQCSGRGGQEKGHLGSRHAIRATHLWIMCRLAAQALNDSVGPGGAGAYCVNRKA